MEFEVPAGVSVGDVVQVNTTAVICISWGDLNDMRSVGQTIVDCHYQSRDQRWRNES